MKRFKKMLTALFVLVLLSGCSQKKSIATSYGYIDRVNNKISIISSYCDEQGNSIQSGSKVKVQIENYNGETVYEGTIKSSKKDCFEYDGIYYSEAFVPMEEIAEGYSSNGILYYWIETTGVEQSGKYREELTDILPTKGICIEYEELPLEVNSYNLFTGWVSETLRVDAINVEQEKNSEDISITLTGEKLSGIDDNFFTFYFYLYDEQGNLIREASDWTDLISAGDAFEVDNVKFYALTPGQTYKLVIKGEKNQ